MREELPSSAYECMLNRFEIGLNIKFTHIPSMYCSVVPVVKLPPIMRHPTARIGTIRRCNKLPLNCAVILSDAIDGWERLWKLVPIIRAYSVAYFGARGAGRSAVFRKSHGKALHRSYTLKWSLDLGSSLGLACYGITES